MSTRILIADDHEIVRRAIRGTLENHDELEIIGEAVNGEEAVQKSLHLKPDIVIMDIAMPVMDGFRAAEIIKKIEPRVSIVVFSMFAEWAGPAQRAGFDGFISKDNSSTGLLRAIDAILHHKKYFHN